jgi:PAS domain S-box-containing protein/diguanylate cyclase (GGDEF)-like protein
VPRPLPDVAPRPLDPARLGAALIDAAPDAVFVVDPRGVIRLVNHEAERLFGYARGALLGRPIEDLVPAPHREAHRGARAGYAAAPNRRTMGRVEVEAERADGTTFWLAVSLSPIEIDGEALVIAIGRDVGERRAMEEQLRYLCSHDALTGLATRGRFDEEIARLEGGRGYPISILIGDLDGLKAINDRDGHAAGDRTLRAIAAVLRDTFRAEDLIARLGGDEFGVLLPGVGTSGLEDALARLRVSARAAGIAISLGGATATAPGQLGPAREWADRRMYADKGARGRGARPAEVAS